MEVKNKQQYFLKIPLLFLCIVILSFFGLNSASAADPSHVYVNTTGNNDYNGQSAVYDGTNGPKATVKNGTGTVKTNGTIYIANGIYKEHGINIYTNMTIIGETQKKTIIYAEGYDTIFNIANGVNLTLINLTLTNGTANNGGAIHNNGTLTVTNCTLQNNTANNQGGAIYNRGGTITINNSTIQNNTATYGGTITNSGTITINNSTIQNNTATYGGTIYNYGTITINNSTIQNNTANNQGGTIYNSGTITLTSCTLQNNKANGQGGVIFNYATVIINNSTVKNNTAHDGGAIYNNGVIEITSSTLKNNSADGFGGAIFNTGQDASYLHFNWIVGNSAILGSAIYKIEAGTLDATNNWWGSNLASDVAANIVGYVNYNPWVILTVNATPAKINNGQTSTVTADFNHINGGAPLVGGHIPEGPITLTIPWGSFTNPEVTHSITENTVNGMISTTFYANEGAVNPLYNPVQITAKADNYITTDTESAYIQINKTANIKIIKTGLEKITAGKNINYTITVTNNGPDPAYNVQLVDNIPIILKNVTHDSFNLGTIDTGQTMTVTITGTVPSNTQFGTIINNNATVTTDTTGNITPSDNIRTTVNVEHKLNITNIVDKSRPHVDDTVKFTVTIHNNGPNDATNLQIKDIMSRDFKNIIITPSKGTYANGIWTLNLANGETAILTLQGKVTTSMAGKNTTNTATILGTTNNASATIYVPKSQLYMKITSNNNSPQIGETFKLTYKIGNNGPDPAKNVTITIPLPNGFVLANITGDGSWIHNTHTNTIIWTLNTIPVGDPYLYVSGKFMNPGNYTFGSSISSETLQINIKNIDPDKNNTQPVVNAATETVPMQKTGIPIGGLIIGTLSILGGLIITQKK
jgi:uncharacterized repeat protein (TIGR01451 family)